MILPLLRDQLPLSLLSTWRLGMEEEVGRNEQGKFTEGYGPFFSTLKNE